MEATEEMQAGKIIGFTKDGLLAVPAAIDATTAAKIFGLSATDIPVLAARKMLKPLGKPSQQAPKFYLTSEIQRLAKDPAWMEKAFQIHYEHWRTKNSRKSVKPISELSIAA